MRELHGLRCCDGEGPLACTPSEMTDDENNAANAIRAALPHIRDQLAAKGEALAPDIIRQAKAEALREAATSYQLGGWAQLPQPRIDLAAKRRQAEHAVAWLRSRADRIEARRG